MDKDNSGGNVDLNNGNMNLNSGNMEFDSRNSNNNNNNKIDELNIIHEGFMKFDNDIKKNKNKIGNGVKGKVINTGEKDNIKDKNYQSWTNYSIVGRNGTIRYGERVTAYSSEYQFSSTAWN